MPGATHRPPRVALEHVIPFRSYVALGVGVIVGVGWVVYSGQWMQDGGPLGAMLAFLIGGLLLLPIGMCYAEMTAAIPLAGGELAFAYKAFGRLPAFLTAWLLALGYVAIAPFETIAVGAMLESLVPNVATDALYHVRLGSGEERVSTSTIIPGCAVGALLLWVNWRGMKASGNIQMLFVSTMLVCTLVFCGVALFRGDLGNLYPLIAGVGRGEHTVAVVASAVISVLVVVPFFMAGFDTIPQAAEEAGAKVPPRDLGVAILISICCGALFYVLIIFAVAISMPWTESARLPMTTSAVFEAAFGFVWAAKLVLVTAMLGLISTLNGVYVASSRLLFSMGRGGLIPGWFARVHPAHHTPQNALLFVGIVSLLGPFVGKSALIPIVNTSSFAFTCALTVTCFSTFRLQMLAPALIRPYRAARPFVYAGMAISVVLLLLMVVPQSPGQLGRLEFLVLLVWITAGAIAYLRRRYTHPLAEAESDRLILGDYR